MEGERLNDGVVENVRMMIIQKMVENGGSAENGGNIEKCRKYRE